MRKFAYLVSLTLLVCGCAQEPQMTWNYSRFSDNAMLFDQAEAICRGYADNAALGIVAEIAPDDIQCYPSYAGKQITTNCYNDNAQEQLTNNIRAEERRKEVKNNAFRSCMAERGWDAKLVPVVKPDDAAQKD